MHLKAQEWAASLQSGTAINKAEIAKREGVSRAYVTKVLKLIENE
jgi:DNA-binding IscR family transcriptional regulator